MRGFERAAPAVAVLSVLGAGIATVVVLSAEPGGPAPATDANALPALVDDARPRQFPATLPPLPEPTPPPPVAAAPEPAGPGSPAPRARAAAPPAEPPPAAPPPAAPEPSAPEPSAGPVPAAPPPAEPPPAAEPPRAEPSRPSPAPDPDAGGDGSDGGLLGGLPGPVGDVCDGVGLGAVCGS